MIAVNAIGALRGRERVLMGDTDCVYLLPHPLLRGWISNYTITFPRPGMMSDDYAVIPHGSATLVFALDERGIAANLFGPITRPAQVGRHANSSRMLFIVEFQPAGFYAFGPMPQNELTDRVFAFDQVDPALFRRMKEHLEQACDIDGLLGQVDELLLANLKQPSRQQAFAQASQMILQSGGHISVQALAQNVYYTQRHLGRLFEKYMGLSAKGFARLVRVNRAIHMLRQPDTSLTQAYLNNGFFDMPHFIRDFKSICGITPLKYRANMSDFYSEIAKF